MTEWWNVPTWRGQQLKLQHWNLPDATAPLRWKKPRVVLLSDFFRPGWNGWTDEDRDRVFAVMTLCPQHLFVLPTFFAENAKNYIINDPRDAINAEAGLLMHWDDMPSDPVWPLRNLWLGIHVKTQAEADEIVHKILAIPAALRFVHITPRESIRLDNVGGRWVDCHNALTGEWEDDLDDVGSSTLNKWTNKLDWVIVEGGADPMHPDWVRSLRDQCAGAGVPFNFAGWGKLLPWGDWVTDEDAQATKQIIIVRHSNSSEITRYLFMGDQRRSGRLLDGVEHNAFPEGLE